MRPTHYFELTLTPSDSILLYYPTKHILCGAIWRAVHGLAAHLRIPFAIAFPDVSNDPPGLGERLRLFGEGEAAIRTLRDAWMSAPGYQDGASASALHPAPVTPAFEAYFMRRLPSAPSHASKTISLATRTALQDAARERRRIEQVDLPFAWMTSSSGRTFRLVVERLPVTPGHCGLPNGYGLSRATEVLALPVFA